MPSRKSPLHLLHRRSLRRKRGQTLVEYGLIATMISVLAIAVLTALGGHVKSVYSTINSQMASADTGGAGSGGSGGGGGSSGAPPPGHG